MSDKTNKKFWDRFAKLYGLFLKKDKKVYDQVSKNLIPYLDKNMDVLKLACGSGQMSFSLFKYSKSWLGTDFSQQMIREAKKRGEEKNLKFKRADASSLSYENESFDCILIANALHIMPNPGQVMKEISRVLKPNGILLAPTFLWKEGRNKQILKTLMAFLGFKVYQKWDKKDFEDFIEGYGFSLVEMKLVYEGFSPIGVMVVRKVRQEFL